MERRRTVKAWLGIRRRSEGVEHAEEGVKHPHTLHEEADSSAPRQSRSLDIGAVVLGLALIGFLHLTRGTAVRHVRGVAADGAAIGVGEPEFPLMVTMATGAWLASATASK